MHILWEINTESLTQSTLVGDGDRPPGLVTLRASAALTHTRIYLAHRKEYIK